MSIDQAIKSTGLHAAGAFGGPRQHFVHSKVMAWVAIDRWVQLIEQLGLPDDAAPWRELRTLFCWMNLLLA